MADTHTQIDWYERRDELRADMVFTDYEGDIVRLYRTVEGDGTKWHVEDYANGQWYNDGNTIEPGDLVAKIEDPSPPPSGFGM